MKRILNIALYFLILTFSIALPVLSESNTLCSSSANSTGCIQTIQKETVTLITNNNRDCELSSHQEDNDQTFSDLTPIILAYQHNNIFDKNKTLSNGCFIHNLSTDKQKTHHIRAP